MEEHNDPRRFMNQELHRSFPQKTLEAITGRRKREDYKNMITTLLTQLRNANRQGEHQPQLQENVRENDLDAPILDYLESLPPLRTEDFYAEHLQLIWTKTDPRGRASL